MLLLSLLSPHRWMALLTRLDIKQPAGGMARSEGECGGLERHKRHTPPCISLLQHAQQPQDTQL
jgi:hypothetical protein